MTDHYPPTIYETFTATAEKYAEKTAVVYLGTKYSYGRIRELVEAFGIALHNIGVRQDDKIIIYLPNSISWVVGWLGIQMIGATAVPISPIYTAYDLEYMANDSDAESIICADTNFGYAKQALRQTKVKRLIVSNVVDMLPWWKRFFGWASDKVPRGKVAYDERTFSFRKLIFENMNKASKLYIKKSTIPEILYTGGTTKGPKGVPIDHKNFLHNADLFLSTCDNLFLRKENIVLGSAPLYHMLAQIAGFSVIITGGGLLLLQPGVNLDGIFKAIERYKANSIIGVPAFYRMILEHDRLDQYDLSPLKYCFSGGDVLPLEVTKRWKRRFGIPISQGYGSTETCGGVTMSPTDRDNPLNSMGLALPGKEIRIVDSDTLKTVSQGEPGELIVRSNPMITGYWKKPEETEKQFIDMDGRKWYRTGDIVYKDEAGYYYFVDRTVDTIKYKGYRISASEIEAVLQEHQAVIASCVVGLDDPKVGQRIKAFVVLKEDIKGITGYELTKWCRERMAPYKVPKYIEFRDMLPKSKVGKLLRREIRSQEKKTRGENAE